ncbi:MAG: hypothetical protein V1484_02805 [bacterium]
MTWQTILTILASLSIPSIGVSIFLYLKDRKYKKWEAERDLKLKEIEFEEEIDKNKKEYGKLGGYRSYLFDNKENFLDKLEQSKTKLKKIGAEIDYLSKMSGKKNPYELFTKKTFLQKVKEKLK